jgi:glycine/D-amino acid oxidase-like deaminating enzyme
MHVVICGGGVIGACTGYFLARQGIDVTVVERSEVASSASGKAGGFLSSTGVRAARLMPSHDEAFCFTRVFTTKWTVTGVISACPRTAA